MLPTSLPLLAAVAQPISEKQCLRPPDVGERNVRCALPPPDPVPFGLAMTGEIESSFESHGANARDYCP